MKTISTDRGNIKVFPFESLGHANHGWLETRHHFSFADYLNRDRMYFGNLRVINDDIIAPGKGFDFHPHKNMEIITYVRQGAITHKDSMGNEGRTSAGNIQVMSAGRGVVHAEYNLEKEETILYQIWITPNQMNVEPRYEAKMFHSSFVTDELKLLVSGRAENTGKGALFIYQDAAIYGGRLEAEKVISVPIKYQAYVVISEGEALINGTLLKKGDGAEVTNAHTITVEAKTTTEIIVIDAP